jgi:hypothetical protein
LIKSFEKPIHATRPFLPPLAEFYQGLSEIWETLSLTNDGPILKRFTRKLCDIFEFDDQGNAHVLEINFRFGGGYPVSHFAGAGFPEMIVRMGRGERVEPLIGKYDKGVVMMKELRVIKGVHNNFFQDILKVRKDAHGAGG